MPELPDLTSCPMVFYNIKMKGGPNPFRNALSGQLERSRTQENITVFVRDNEIEGIVVPKLKTEGLEGASELNLMADEELGSIGNFAAALRGAKSALTDRPQNLPVFVKRGQAVFGYGFYVPNKNIPDLEAKGVIPKIEIPRDTKLGYEDIEKLLSEPSQGANGEEGKSLLERHGFEINPFCDDMDIPASRIRSELFLQSPNKAFEALQYLEGDDIAIIRERTKDGSMEVIGMLSRIGADFNTDLEEETQPDAPQQIFPERGGETCDAFSVANQQEPEDQDLVESDDETLEETVSIECGETIELYKIGIKAKRNAEVIPALNEGKGLIVMSLGALGIVVSESIFDKSLKERMGDEVIEDVAITTFAKSGIDLLDADNKGASSIARISNRDGDNIIFIPTRLAANLLIDQVIEMPNHLQLAQVWIDKNTSEGPLMAAQ